MKKVLIPLAEGFEEIEVSTIVGVLRRANLNVVLAGLPSTMVKSARGVSIVTDKKLDDIKFDDFDALILPGGSPGYTNLARSQKVLSAVEDFSSKKKLIGAICGAPFVLAKAGILDNKRATIYPGMEKELPRPRSGRVVIDENIITSQGPGTAMEFALKLVEILVDRNRAMEIKRDLVC
jgi:4-methyl-5(b-hydroxyethyl)-thiazole monophosphate biosynthesis